VGQGGGNTGQGGGGGSWVFPCACVQTEMVCSERRIYYAWCRRGGVARGVVVRRDMDGAARFLQVLENRGNTRGIRAMCLHHRMPPPRHS